MKKIMLIISSLLTVLGLSSCTINELPTNPGGDDPDSGNNNPGGGVENTEREVPTDAIKAYRKAVANNGAFKGYYVDNEGYYYVFESSSKFYSIGTFDQDKLAFTDSTSFAFDLANIPLTDTESVINGSEILVNIDTKEAYNLFNLNSEIDSQKNEYNYSNLYFYNYNDDLDDYSFNLKTTVYDIIENEDIRNYFTSVFYDIHDINYSNETRKARINYDIYNEIVVPSTFNGRSVKILENISEPLTKLGISTIGLTLSEGVEVIEENSLKDLTIKNTTLTLPSSLKEIKDGAFSGTNVNNLYIHDNEISLGNEVFKDSNVTSVQFESELTENSGILDAIKEESTSGDKIEGNYGNSLEPNSYNSLTEAINGERLVNPWLELSAEGYSLSEDGTTTLISDPNLTEIGKDKVLVVSTSATKLDGTHYLGEDVRVLNNMDTSTAHSYPDHFDEAFIKEKTHETLRITLQSNLVIKGKAYFGAYVNSASQQCQGYVTGDYTTLDLNGHTITIEEGGELVSSGYVIDSSQEKTGEIIVNNGGKIVTNFTVEDYGGGSITLGRYSGNVSPFTLFRTPYLQAKTTINYGGSLDAYAVLYASSAHNQTIQSIVGNSSNALIQLKEGSSVTKSFDNSLTNGTDIYEINNGAIINPMQLDVGIVTVNTSNVLLPFTKYQKIIFNGGDVEVATKAKILPGCEVIINDANIILKDQIFVYKEYKSRQEVKDLLKNQSLALVNYPDYYRDNETYPEGKLEFKGNSTLTLVDDGTIVGNITVDNENLYNNIVSQFSNINIVETLTSREGSATGSSIFARFTEYYSYTDNPNIRLVDTNNNLIKTTLRNGNRFYKATYNNGKENSYQMTTLNGTLISTMNYTGEGTRSGWSFNYNGETIGTNNVENTFNLYQQVNDTLYIYTNETWNLATYDDNTKLYSIGDIKLINCNNEFVQGTLINDEKKVFESNDNSYYVYLNNNWTPIELFNKDYTLISANGTGYGFIDGSYKAGKRVNISGSYSTSSGDYYCDNSYKYYVPINGTLVESESPDYMIAQVTIDNEAKEYVFFNGEYISAERAFENVNTFIINGKTYGLVSFNNIYQYVPGTYLENFKLFVFEEETNDYTVGYNSTTLSTINYFNSSLLTADSLIVTDGTSTTYYYLTENNGSYSFVEGEIISIGESTYVPIEKGKFCKISTGSTKVNLTEDLEMNLYSYSNEGKSFILIDNKMVSFIDQGEKDGNYVKLDDGNEYIYESNKWLKAEMVHQNYYKVDDEGDITYFILESYGDSFRLDDQYNSEIYSYDENTHIYTIGSFSYMYVIDGTGKFLRVRSISDRPGYYTVYNGCTLEGSFAEDTIIQWDDASQSWIAVE